MLDDIDDEDFERAKLFDDLITTVNEDCGSIQIPDRCENAVEVAKCFDRILEMKSVEKNTIIGGDFENSNNKLSNDLK